MKYLFFFAALIAVLPATMLLVCEKKFIRWAIVGLFVPVLIFNSSAINFFSEESYRGTARGMEISIIYLVALTILLALTVMRGYRKIFPEFGSLFYLLYFLFSLPSLQHADNLMYSFFELWKMIMIYLVFLAVYHYLEFSKGDFDIFIYSIIIVIVFNFMSIVLQRFQGIYQARGVFIHQNSMAMYMQLTCLLCFSRFFNLNEGKRSGLFFFGFGVSAVSLVWSFSRGAIACFPIDIMLTLLGSIRYKFSVRKIYIIIMIMILGLIGLAVFLPRIIERFQKAPEASGQTRKDFAIAALNMMRDCPWAGVGINNWGIRINPPYDYSRHREEMRMSDDYKDGIVETIYLLVGAECGIPCLLCLLLWFAYYWFSSIRLLYRLRNTPYFYIPAGALGGMTGVFLQSALEWVLKQQVNFMLLVIIFAFISYLNRHSRELAKASTAPRPVPAQIKEAA